MGGNRSGSWKPTRERKSISLLPPLSGEEPSPALARRWWSSFGSSHPDPQAEGEREVRAVRMTESAPKDGGMGWADSGPPLDRRTSYMMLQDQPAHDPFLILPALLIPQDRTGHLGPLGLCPGE